MSRNKMVLTLWLQCLRVLIVWCHLKFCRDRAVKLLEIGTADIHEFGSISIRYISHWTSQIRSWLQEIVDGEIGISLLRIRNLKISLIKNFRTEIDQMRLQTCFKKFLGWRKLSFNSFNSRFMSKWHNFSWTSYILLLFSAVSLVIRRLSPGSTHR